ncbi:MAG: hypothetical protein AAF333_05090 [Planctomycetota bacterium]
MTRRQLIPAFFGVLVILTASLGVRGQSFDVDLETPRRVMYKTLNGERGQADVVGYSREAFRVQAAEGETDAVAWDTLDPATAERVWKKLLRKNDALGWAHAGVVYRDLEIAQGLTDARVRRSDMAFDRALRLDPSLADRVDEWRRGSGAAESPAPEPAATENLDDPGVSANQAAPPSRPRHAQFWKQLSPEEHARRTNAAREWTQGHLDAIGVEYTVTETAHFVLFSDTSLGRRDREFTLNLLEEMYQQCLDMFALGPDDQVYAGKCTLVVIRRPEDFFAYEKQAYNRVTNALGGVCHYLPNGDVQIVAHRSDDEWFFRKMLVHENVHGFVHRYRSQASIPIWMNEGLAEYIAHRIVPQSTVVESRRREAHGEFHRNRDMYEIFRRWPGGQWPYGISYGLTELMIDGDRLAYRQLFHDIKDGVDWVEALQNNFRVDPPGLISLYCQVHNLPDPAER